MEFYENIVDFNPSKNILKALQFSCGSSDVRLMCAKRMDTWLQHGKVNSSDMICLIPFSNRLLEPSIASTNPCKTISSLNFSASTTSHGALIIHFIQLA